MSAGINPYASPEAEYNPPGVEWIRGESAELAKTRQGLTLVPLSIYFNASGRAKVELAVARGKKMHDKRDTEKERDWKREQGRLLRKHG